MTIQPFETTVRGLALRGLTSLPDGAGPWPTAVLLHGFGGCRVEGARLFVELSRALTRAGVAVVAFDRAGHGESDGDFFDTSATGDVQDVLEVLDAVAALDAVDGDDLHLVGLSLGAVIAAVVAARSTPPVRSLTMWSTAAVFVDEIASGSIQGRSLAGLATDGYFDFMGQRMGPAMVEDARTFDPYALAAPYTGPVLLMHGTADFVPVSYAQRYAEMWGSAATLDVVPGADHGWADVPHRDQVIAATVGFVLRNRRSA